MFAIFRKYSRLLKRNGEGIAKESFKLEIINDSLLNVSEWSALAVRKFHEQGSPSHFQ